MTSISKGKQEPDCKCLNWTPPIFFCLKKCCCCYCYVASVVSDSIRPHRRQPTRLPHPWDSPGKTTGVGCHFLLQCMNVKSESEVAQSCPTLSDPMDCSPPGSSAHRIFQARVLEWGAVAFSSLFANQLQTKAHNANVRVLFQSGPTYFIFYIKKKK